MRDRTTPAARAALVGGAALALLAVVALASRGGLGGGAATAGSPSGPLVSYAYSVFLVLLAAAAPFSLWAYVRQLRRGELPRAPRRGRFLRVLANVLVFCLFFLVTWKLSNLHRHPGEARRARGSAATSTGAGPGVRHPAAQPAFEWPVAAVAAAILLAGLVAYLALRRRREVAQPSVAGELALALDDAIDDVRTEQDPRRAVIKAYARMETVLTAHGLVRQPADTPHEYLARALLGLDASARSVERLTELFERARFSLHEIDASMRADALEALAAVRAEVAA